MSQTIRELFDQALEIEKTHRSRWLDRHCKSSSRKRAVLNALLENNDTQRDFIRRAVESAAEEVLDSESDDKRAKYLALLNHIEQLRKGR